MNDGINKQNAGNVVDSTKSNHTRLGLPGAAHVGIMATCGRGLFPCATTNPTTKDHRKSMPRVLHVLEATIGGTRRHLRELAPGLVEKGWQVDLAYALGRDPAFTCDLDLFVRHGVGVHEVRMLRRPAPLADVCALGALERLIRATHPDVVHGHSAKGGMLARLAAHRRGVPAVYTPHFFACEMQVAPWLRTMYRAMERLARPWGQQVIAVSRAEHAAARALGYAPERIALIPNGVPPPPAAGSRRETEKYDLAFAGRFCRQKGLDVLLAALPALRRRHPGLRVAVMGNGDRRLERLAAAETDLVLLPAAAPEQVWKLLLESRVLAMPSRWEGLPYLLLEAMQAGTPVVASEVGGVADVVTSGVDGRLVPPDNPAALSEALGDLLADAPGRRALAEAARDRVRQFSLRRMVDDTDRVLREVAGV